MTRKKVNLIYITNDSVRKSTFKKRKKGMMKKAHELSTLCDVEVCVIIFSTSDAEPEVWPSHLGAQRVIAKFRRMPELEQSKKMVNQETFARERLAKSEEQLRKQQKDNRHKEVADLMYRCLIGVGLEYLSMIDLRDLGWLLNQNTRDAGRRIESLKKGRAAGTGGREQGDGGADAAVAAAAAPEMDLAETQNYQLNQELPGNMGGDEGFFPFGSGMGPGFFYP
ncbi:hypothetical protein U1Q18_035938 [Sarracenia purpurea var. burkii]